MDLTNTKWKFHDTISNYEYMSKYGINNGGGSYSSKNKLISRLSSGTYSYDIVTLFSESIYGYSLLVSIYVATPEFLSKYNDGDAMAFVPENHLGLSKGWYWANYSNIGGAIPIEAPTIEIYSGDLTTDTEFISWLKENATFIGFI